MCARWPTLWPTGQTGCDRPAEDAVLNANYIRKGLEGSYDLPYKTPTMHEVVFSDRLQTPKGIKTGDIAKRLIDYGFHPYTVSFPLVVPGALMIEPTESESKASLDMFIEAMKDIAEEAQEHPEIIVEAPHNDSRISRLDETEGGARAGPALEAAGRGGREVIVFSRKSGG